MIRLIMSLALAAFALSSVVHAQAPDPQNTLVIETSKGNISIKIRRSPGDLSYLSMEFLANLVDKARDAIKEAALSRDATEFKPIRDAVAHTALLTDEAKVRLSTVRQNIKGRVKTLLSGAK